MTATQVSRRLLETSHELVYSQMASSYDSVIEFSYQLELTPAFEIVVVDGQFEYLAKSVHTTLHIVVCSLTL